MNSTPESPGKRRILAKLSLAAITLGGLLLENPTPDPGQTNRFWLLLTAKAVDANGRLLGR